MATKHLDSQTHHLGVTILEDLPPKDTIIGCRSIRSLQYLYFWFLGLLFTFWLLEQELKGTADIGDLCTEFSQHIRLAQCIRGSLETLDNSCPTSLSQSPHL